MRNIMASEKTRDIKQLVVISREQERDHDRQAFKSARSQLNYGKLMHFGWACKGGLKDRE